MGDILFANKVGKLPVVDEDYKLMALLCRGDVNRTREHPNAARDATRQLLCAASVAANSQDDWERCEALIGAGVDILSVDTDEGVTDVTVEFIRKLKEEHAGDVEILAGRVSSLA